MLVVTRAEGEAIVIDEQITVRVLRIRSGKVSLGIEAPSDISMTREEFNPLQEVDPLMDDDDNVDAVESEEARSRRAIDSGMKRAMIAISRMEAIVHDPAHFAALLQSVDQTHMTQDEASYIAEGAAKAVVNRRNSSS